VLIASLSATLESAVGDHGLYAVFGLMAIDAVFPAASELVMLYAGAVASGALAGQNVVLFGHRLGSGFSAWLAMALAGTLGYLAGGIAGWWIGKAAGRPYLERHGRWLHLDAAKLDRAEAWFDRWGEWAVLVGRITPVMRSFISIPAGVFRMPLGRYVAFTLIGSAIWAFAFSAAGWGLGASWEHLHERFRYADYAVAALVVAGIAVLVWKLARRGRGVSESGPGYTRESE